MKRIEAFSRHSGLKLSIPFIYKSFFPIKDEKFITFNNYQIDQKQYDCLQIVIDLIEPFLTKEDIKIYQLGLPSDPALSNCNSLCGATTINQAAYIINKSLLHFGVDSALTHISAQYQKPTICLYSGLPPEVNGPFEGFSSSNSHISNITGYKEGVLPSYSEQESIKTINNINPEDISCRILDTLGIDHDINTFKTLYFGDLYKYSIIECVPDFTPDPSFMINRSLNIRLDYHFDEKNIIPFANGRKLNIITDKEIDLKILKICKNNIECITYHVDESSNIDFIKDSKSLGIDISLISKDNSNLNEARLKFIDFDIKEKEFVAKKDLDLTGEICDNSFFFTNKILISQGKKFASKVHYEKNIEFSDQNKVFDTDDFWFDSKHYLIYNHAKNKENR
jgi:hypothetical protein